MSWIDEQAVSFQECETQTCDSIDCEQTKQNGIEPPLRGGPYCYRYTLASTLGNRGEQFHLDLSPHSVLPRTTKVHAIFINRRCAGMVAPPGDHMYDKDFKGRFLIVSLEEFSFFQSRQRALRQKIIYEYVEQILKYQTSEANHKIRFSQDRNWKGSSLYK